MLPKQELHSVMPKQVQKPLKFTESGVSGINMESPAGCLQAAERGIPSFAVRTISHSGNSCFSFANALALLTSVVF